MAFSCPIDNRSESPCPSFASDSFSSLSFAVSSVLTTSMGFTGFMDSAITDCYSCLNLSVFTKSLSASTSDTTIYAVRIIPKTDMRSPNKENLRSEKQSVNPTIPKTVPTTQGIMPIYQYDNIVPILPKIRDKIPNISIFF